MGYFIGLAVAVLTLISPPVFAANVVEGTSVAQANVYLSCYNYSAYKYPWQSTTAASDGSFSFNSSATYGPCGSYYSGYAYTCKVSAYPAWGTSDYVSATSSEFTANCSETTTITLAHAKKDKTIKVSLTDGVGAITSGITVYAYQSDGNSYDYSTTTSASGGVYTLKATSGKYYVGAYCTNYSDCDYSGYPSTYVTLGSSDTSKSASLTFKSNNSSLAVAVTNGSSGIASAYVSAYSYGDSASTYSSGTSSYVYVSGQTNSSGGITLKVPAGKYTISVNPPSGSLFASQTKEVTVGNAELLTVNVTLSSKSAPFTVTVKDGNGSAIQNAYISGWTNDGGTYDYFWGQTSSSGIMTAYAVEGRKYQVSAYYWPSYSNGVTTSKICNYNQEGYQTAKANTSGVAMSFTFPICDNTVSFSAVNSNGALLSAASYGWVEVKPAAQTSTDSYYAGTGASISNGSGSVKVRANTKYIATLYIWDSSYIAGDPVTFTSGASDGTTNVSLTMLAADATVGGSFVDADGKELSVSDISYVYVYAVKDKAYRSCTISKGSYSCSVSSGKWCLGYWVDYNSGYVSVSPGASTQCYTITSGQSLSKSITLLKTGSIIATIKDPVGSPVQNAWVEATATSVADYGSSHDNYYYGQGCVTNSSGTCTINVGASASGTTYYVNVHTPYSIMSDNNWTDPSEESVTIAAGGSAEVVLSFGKPDGEITLALAEGLASLSKAAARAQKSVLKAASDDSSPIHNATVDIFANSGAYATGETNESGEITLNCTKADKWYAVAHHIFGNTLYMSEATEFNCHTLNAENIKPTAVTIKAVATLPECQSKTFDASVATSLECTDGFSISFPSAVLDSYGSSVSVSVSPVVTPFKANMRPATFYGWRVKATKTDSAEEIIQLDGYATITCPCDTTQLEKLGLKLADTKAVYHDPSQNAYKAVAATNDSTDCKVTMTTNHLTDFIIAGNGNLSGLDGTEGGVTPGDTTSSGSSSNGGGGCGCRTNSGPVNLPTALLVLLPFLPALLIRRLFRTKKVKST